MNEKEINLTIYNKLADIAREVFKHVICEPGTYSVADVAKHIYTAETSERVRKVCADGVTREVNEPRITRSLINGFYWAEGYDPAKDTHAVEVEGFACKVNGWGVFLVLRKAATAWAIPTAARPVFARKAETADPAAADSIAATFAVNKELRDLAAIVDPREKLRPVYTYICIDTRRRAAIACNGFTLRVVALPDLMTAPGAADSYLIAPALLKSGKGRVTITADGYASNGATVAPLGEGRFPDWAGFVSSSLSNYNYSEAARVELSRPTFNALKKSVKAAAKLSERVTIAAQSYDTAATVYAHDIDHDCDHESRAELAAPARSSFNVVLRVDQFAKLADVTAFYIVSNAAPVLAAASLGFYYFNPLLAEDGEKYYTPFNVVPAGAMYDPLTDFAEVPAPAADSIETPAAETIVPAEVAAPAADSEADTPTAETIESDTPAEVAAPAADLTADTNEPTPAETIESETAAAEVAAPAADLTAESEADTITAAERERLADTINSDNDPERAAFAVGDVFELLTDTGTTVPARVRSLYFNNFDDTADPCWVYCYDCEPWINRYGQTIDGGSCDALRMKATDTPAPAADLTAESEAETTAAAPAADSEADTPTAETIESDTPAEVAAPAALTAAAELLTLAEVRDAAKAIAKAKTADDYDSQRAARDARRLLTTAHGLTVTDYRIKTADGLTLTRFIYTYGKKSRRTLCAPLLKVAAEFATLESLADEWAELNAAAADTNEPTAAPVLTITPAPAADLTAESEAETTAAAPAADSEADTPTAETIESDTPAEVAAPAAGSEADTLPLLTIATADSQTADRAERRPLLLTVARYALRLAAAAALLLLLTIAPDRAADTLAAPAADSEADTITAAELLTADSEAESRAEVAAPADSPRPTAERRHAPANKRESHARALLTIATADSIAAPVADSIAAPLLTIEADTLTAAPTADSIAAPLLAIEVDTLTAVPAADLTADTPTDDTDSKADTITTDEPTDDTDPAAADSQTDSTPTDTAANGHPHAHGSTPAAPAAPCSPSAPVAPIVIVCFGI